MNSLQTGLSALSNIWRSVGSERFATARLTDSALVCPGPCLLLECGGAYVTENENVSPSSHNDPDNAWTNEANAYDDDTDSYTSKTGISAGWSKFLELIYDSEIFCPAVRFYAAFSFPSQRTIDIDHWDGSSWVDIYQGTYANLVWVTKALPALALTRKGRVRFYKPTVGPFTQKLYEFDFIRRKVLDAKFYDGFDTTGRQKYRVLLNSTGGVHNRFVEPIYFDAGLYVDFAEAVGDCFVRYLPLEPEPE